MAITAPKVATLNQCLENRASPLAPLCALAHRDTAATLKF